MDISRANKPIINGTSTTEEIVRNSNEVSIYSTTNDDDFSRKSTQQTLQPLVDKKKLIRKIDFRLLLILVVLYCLDCLDRTNIGNARLAGLENNLGLYGNQYQISLAVFYIGYVLFEIPSNMVIKKFTPSKWIPTLMVVWSAVVCCMAAVKYFGELIATRLFLGVFEAGFTPGAFFLLSMWYKRSQCAVRFSLFYSGSVLSGAFGFILPNFPETATFLTVQERDYWVTCLRKDDCTLNDSQHYKIDHHSLYLVVKDLKIYIAMLLGIFIGIALHSITLYLPTVIYSMGFDPLKSQLLTVPPYFAGWCIALAITLHSDKVEERSFHLIFTGCLAIIGFFGLAMIKNITLLYVSTFFCTAGVSTASPLAIAWVSSIFSIPHDKRAIALAMYLAFANISGVVSSMLYPTNDGPRYLILTVILRFMLINENKKMDQRIINSDTKRQDSEVSDFRYVL
ncbi:major facilitator superfamily domain-containing protein [Gigaspora rosea]|uniref:Major facilitator superfamily domain-containing protein n=1 Tax=Gigaspora rosea TaxID=44941 RepID=A0A397W357_9GLOM|nr:major facilitator superfamily domain-containing protein [Gigaspora rosea]